MNEELEIRMAETDRTGADLYARVEQLTGVQAMFLSDESSLSDFLLMVDEGEEEILLDKLEALGLPRDESLFSIPLWQLEHLINTARLVQ